MGETKFDDRPIVGIWWNDGSDGYTTAMPRVTDIRVVAINGQMAEVQWFEVWNVGHLLRRVNSAHVTEVTYD